MKMQFSYSKFAKAKRAIKNNDEQFLAWKI
jgi:hypothetical protein